MIGLNHMTCRSRLVAGLLAFGLATFVLVDFAALAQTQDVGGIATNLRTQASPVMQGLTSVLFVVGVFFVGSALFQLKRMGVNGAQFGNVSFRNPLLTGVAGIGLLYLTTVAGIGGNTVFGTGSSDVTIQGTTTLQ